MACGSSLHYRSSARRKIRSTMPIFEYAGTDAQGNPVQGTAVGLTLESVANDLSRRGVLVDILKVASAPGDPLQSHSGAAQAPPLTAPTPFTSTRNVWQEVRLEHLHFFFRQLYAMMNAGVNPVAALQTLSTQTQNSRLSSALLDMRAQAQAGKGLACGMERHGDVFSPLMIAIVRAGETGGFTVEALRMIADYIEREIRLRRRIRRATFYPKLVILASIVIIVLTNLILGAIGAPGRLSSPLTSPSTWIVLGPALILLVLFFRFPAKRREVKAAIQALVLRLPWFSGISHGFAMAKFGRAFGALYRAGVPMPQALYMAADACGNEAVRERIYPAADSLKAGLGITEAFRRTGAFTPIALDMAAAGEATGSMDQTLTKLAEYYEEEGSVRSEQSATVLGVVAFLVVAVYVAFVVYNFYSSYLQTNLSVEE